MEAALAHMARKAAGPAMIDLYEAALGMVE